MSKEFKSRESALTPKFAASVVKVGGDSIVIWNLPPRSFPINESTKVNVQKSNVHVGTNYRGHIQEITIPRVDRPEELRQAIYNDARFYDKNGDYKDDIPSPKGCPDQLVCG